MKIKCKVSSYHRNGIAGEGFHVVMFDMKEDGKKHNMVGIVFEGQGHCAVLDIDELSCSNIAFAEGNSWRGDHFEQPLRDYIEQQR